VPSKTSTKERSIKSFIASHISQIMVYVIFLIVLIIFAIWLGDKFFSPTNLLNVTRQTARISVMAVAMTFVIASGQIDLSIGSTVALTSLVVALLLKSTDNILLSVFTGLVLGAFIGLLNGLCITVLRIPAFLATMGMQSIVKGFAM
jgi:ribose transport system permease protein